jgi:RNA polymerase sigma-70 factor (ECF subfamily)
MDGVIVSETRVSIAPSDEEAMARLAAGDSSALGLLFDRHKVPLLGFLWRIVGERALAEDLLGETFVRLYDSRARFRRGASFLPWVLVIARNLALAELRRRRWSRRQPPPETASPEDWGAAGVREELREQVRLALARLPEDQRTAIVLKEYHGLNYREIGLVLGCSEEAARARTYRARGSLRGWLKDYMRDE